MANIKSQEKRIKTNERRRLRNKSVKSSLHTAVRKFHRPSRPATRTGRRVAGCYQPQARQGRQQGCHPQEPGGQPQVGPRQSAQQDLICRQFGDLSDRSLERVIRVGRGALGYPRSTSRPAAWPRRSNRVTIPAPASAPSAPATAACLVRRPAGTDLRTVADPGNGVHRLGQRVGQHHLRFAAHHRPAQRPRRRPRHDQRPPCRRCRTPSPWPCRSDTEFHHGIHSAVGVSDQLRTDSG